ncbi:helix-turn-helix transcriptional regulator [Emticicia sp. 21SJ11W-3]|uniref:XRE family transcriptional regulator n=1 Tax=Emticicia sp. 21SJ11W-3 TaxID=2916755 RepID=UPI0020A1D482|nr:helix-turn-helix transcriptional regulator [Emticicia sp. 21SJ11W-3]UTA70253.1 helix-turn-helix domain-containing protein [Emticicia sp. 21SJ11W-3]
MSLISNNLKYLRRLNGLTQEQFAQRIGTKRANVGAYEEERATPPVDTLKTIAGLFGISVDDFVQKDLKNLSETTLIPIVIDTRQGSQNLFDFQSGNTELKPGTPSQNNLFNASGPHSFTSEPKRSGNNIQLIRRFQFNEYLMRSKDVSFLKTLTDFQLPTLPFGEYRAFEATEDFAFEGALLIGSLVKNWYEIADGKNYVLVTKAHGIIYRRVYNQVKIKGTLLLSSDNQRFPSIEISMNDVIETWEIKAFVSQVLPEPSISFDKVNNLVDELKFELERLKK